MEMRLSPGFHQQHRVAQCKQNGVRQNMDNSNCRLWGFISGILEWNERSDFKDDSFMDVYQFWVFDVDNAFVWFPDKYCCEQTFQVSRA